MSSYEFGCGRLTDKLNLVAVVGDIRVRISDGYVTHMQVVHPEPTPIYSMNSVRRSAMVRSSPTRVVLEAILGDAGLVVDRFDPMAPVPISSKVVEDCTNDELLFVLQYRLGLVKNVLQD